MHLTHRHLFLANASFSCSKIIEIGATEEAIATLGKIIDRSECPDTILACEKLIEVLNEGGKSNPIERLSKEQARFADKVTLAIHDCFVATV